jgi:hypothetical protein
MSQRISVTVDDDTAIVLGVVATADATQHSAVVTKALTRYLQGRLRNPAIARAAKNLGSKMAAETLVAERNHREAGSFTAMVVIMLVALFAVMGLAIDGGRMIATRTALLGDASTAATVAANTPPGGQTAAAEAAVYPPVIFEGVHTTASGSTCVTVSETKPTYVLGLVGIRVFTAVGTSCS